MSNRTQVKFKDGTATTIEAAPSKGIFINGILHTEYNSVQEAIDDLTPYWRDLGLLD